MIIVPHPLFRSSVIIIHDGTAHAYNTNKDSDVYANRLAKLVVLLRQVSSRLLVCDNPNSAWCVILYHQRQHKIHWFADNELPTVDGIINEPAVSNIKIVPSNGDLSLEYDGHLITKSLDGWPHMDDRLKLLHDLAEFYNKSKLFVVGQLSITQVPVFFTITLRIDGIDRQLSLEVPDSISMTNSDSLKLSLIHKISMMLNG